MTEKTPRRGSSECSSIVGAGKCQRENKEKIRRRNKGMTKKREKIKGKKRRALIEGKDKTIWKMAEDRGGTVKLDQEERGREREKGRGRAKRYRAERATNMQGCARVRGGLRH